MINQQMPCPCPYLKSQVFIKVTFDLKETVKSACCFSNYIHGSENIIQVICVGFIIDQYI